MGQEPVELPFYQLPEALSLPRVTLEVPTGELPSYRPLVVPPSDLRAPPGVEASGEAEKNTEKEEPKQQPEVSLPKEITSFTIPFTDYELPVPKQEILVAAGTTASVSVVATLTATAVFKRCVQALKPVITQLVKRIQKKRGKEVPSWSRQRLEQRRSKYVQGRSQDAG
tara:strand:- start:6256 stop:6762 length:507 start_codon:yes stop_codon:yes gene_type:complete